MNEKVMVRFIFSFPLAKHSWLLRSATRSAAWSTPPGSNITLSAQTNRENPNMWKYRYLGLFFPLERNPERIGQSPEVSLRAEQSSLNPLDLEQDQSVNPMDSSSLA